MKPFLLASVCLSLASPAFGQYSARTLTRRIVPPPAAQGTQPAPQQPEQPAVPQAPVPQQPLVRVPPPIVPAATPEQKDAAEKKLIEWQKQRAQSGSDNAQYELGVRYLTGKGVEQNDAEAKKWLQKAAAQGHSQAKRKLEELNKKAAESTAQK